MCGSTSPAWAPIFSKIKATVTDVGGVMSHAAIVCSRVRAAGRRRHRPRHRRDPHRADDPGRRHRGRRDAARAEERHAERAYTRPLDELRRADEPRFGGKSAEPRRAARGRDPGAARLRDLDRGVRGVRRERAAAGSSAIADPPATSTRSRRVARDREAMRSRRSRGRARRGATQLRASSASDSSHRSRCARARSARTATEATFAGQQETYLWVRGAEHVCDAVRDCWASLYSPPAISYRARLGDAAQAPAMGVTVQLMVDAEVSGVMFTCNPVSGDPSMVAINASWGLGLGGRRRRGDARRLPGQQGDRRGRARARARQGRRSTCPTRPARGAVRVEVPERAPRARAASTQPALARAGRARRAGSSAHFGCHQDIEWAIAATIRGAVRACSRAR